MQRNRVVSELTRCIHVLRDVRGAWKCLTKPLEYQKFYIYIYIYIMCIMTFRREVIALSGQRDICWDVQRVGAAMTESIVRKSQVDRRRAQVNCVYFLDWILWRGKEREKNETKNPFEQSRISTTAYIYVRRVRSLRNTYLSIREYRYKYIPSYSDAASSRNDM